MEIVLGMYRLRDPGGTEHYTLIAAEQLQRLGHDVTIFVEETGAMAELALNRGLRLAASEDELPDEADVLYAQESITAYRLAARYPKAPLVYGLHAVDYNLSVPPPAAGAGVGRRHGARTHLPARTGACGEGRGRPPAPAGRRRPLHPAREPARAAAPVARARQLPLRRPRPGDRRRLRPRRDRARPRRRADGSPGARGRAHPQRRGHRGRQGPRDRGGHGVRAGSLRLRHLRQRRLGHEGLLRAARGGQLQRADRLAAGRSRPLPKRPRALPAGHGRREPRARGRQPQREHARGPARRALRAAHAETFPLEGPAARARPAGARPVADGGAGALAGLRG